MRYSAEGLVPASSSDTRSQVCRVEMLQVWPVSHLLNSGDEAEGFPLSFSWRSWS